MKINYTIRGENIEVTPAIRDYVMDKVSKIERYFDRELEVNAHVNLRTHPNKDGKAEVTIPLPQITIRAEETSQDLYGSIDLVVDKLERQIRKHKTRLNRKARETRDYPHEILFVEQDEDQKEESIKIVRSKRFDLKPMMAEEAVLQMEMLGHDFFIFTDPETMTTSIVYRRQSGDFGLIETEIEA